MVGLTGIISSHKDDIEIRELLSLMHSSITYDESHKVDVYLDKGIGLSRVHINVFNPEAQPIFNEDKTKCIMMDGEIFDYQETKADLISKGHIFSINNDPEFVLQLYEEYGDEFVLKLNGIFSIVILDKKLGRLLIISDRYGLRPIFYFNDDGYLLFGSEVKAILQDKKLKKIVDDHSVTDLFAFGYILENRTLFKDINVLPPASILEFIDGKVSIKKYWDFDFNREYKNYNEKYYIDNLSKTIRHAVERQIIGNHKLGALLSGGLDSRTIIGFVRDFKKENEVHTFTYGKKNCNDAKFAQVISERIGTIHHYYEFRPDDIISNAEEVVYKTDGMLNILNAPRMQTYRDIARFSNVIFHGWIGDTTNGDFFDPNIDSNNDNLNIFKRLCPLSADLKNLFNKSYYPIVEQSLNTSKKYILKTGNNIKLPSNRLIYYNLKERQRRLISVGFIYMRNYLESRTPFSDNDYIDFSTNTPSSLKINKNLYKKMILDTFPKFLDIPNANGCDLKKSYYQIKILQMSKLGINKISNKIFGKGLFSNDGSLDDYADWMRTNKKLKDYIIGILLDKRTLERHYFNQEYIKKILTDHMKRKKDHTMLIGMLLTFELWNRQFMDIE